MASEVAEFIRKNFLESVTDTDQLKKETRLPHIITLLHEIKTEFIEHKQLWSPPPPSSLFAFHRLDLVLAEIQAYKEQIDHQTNRKINRTAINLESHLKSIKTELLSMRENSNKVIENEIAESSSRYEDFSSIIGLSSSRNDDFYFLGYDEEIPEKILKCLESDDKFKAIGIHGMCGTGKTTLVKEIVANQRVKRARYAEPIWVCLSDLTYEEIDMRIIKEILLCLNDDVDLLIKEPTNDELVDRLRDKLYNVKYLIVLDGVWHYWHDDETNLPSSFSKALHKDGAIIVTSRVREVTKQFVGENNLIHLEPWDDEKMKQFVMTCLQRSGKLKTITFTDDHNKKINEFVPHCHGLPLVAHTLSDWLASRIDCYSLRKPKYEFVSRYIEENDEDNILPIDLSLN